MSPSHNAISLVILLLGIFVFFTFIIYHCYKCTAHKTCINRRILPDDIEVMNDFNTDVISLNTEETKYEDGQTF